MLMIDGNRDGRLVLFDHDDHKRRHGGEESCGACHHMNRPFDRNASCHECHREMYTAADIFSHSSHVEALGGNDGCAECHRNDREAKTRETALACAECHAEMPVSGSAIQPPEGGMHGFAAGYMDAMHGRCITCHQKKVEEDEAQVIPTLAECATCHRDIDASHLHMMAPYTKEGK